MSALFVPCEFVNPDARIGVEADGDGGIYVDLRTVVDADLRSFNLTTDEARAFAAALLHFAHEQDRRWRR